MSNEADRDKNPASNAVKMLLEGNARWASGQRVHPNSDFARRQRVASDGQKPVAAILACADSRVPVELLFDVGIGDLFVVRVAGNSIGLLGRQSLEFAVDQLGVWTIMVLGHQGCGAVAGAVNRFPESATTPEFLSYIYPAIGNAKDIIRDSYGNTEDKAELSRVTVDQHVIHVVQQLRATYPFKDRLDAHQLTIVGGRYDLDTGRVTMLIE